MNDVDARLLAAVRAIADFTASRDDPVPPYEQIARYCKDTARAAIAEAERETTPRQGSLTEAMDALREVGGKAWDQIDDPAAYLDRTPEPVDARLLAAAKMAEEWMSGRILMNEEFVRFNIVKELRAAIAEAERAGEG